MYGATESLKAIAQRSYNEKRDMRTDWVTLPYNVSARSGMAYPWVPYGYGNLFPDYIRTLTNSATHSQIVRNKGKQTAASGFQEKSQNDWLQSKLKGISAVEFLRRISDDLVRYGGFCFQVVRANDGTIAQLEHTRVRNIRMHRPIDGQVPFYYYSPDWSLFTDPLNKPIVFHAFTGSQAAFDPEVDTEALGWLYPPFTKQQLKDAGMKKDSDGSYIECGSGQWRVKPGVELYYYAMYNDIIEYYPVPDYLDAMNWIALEDAGGRFCLSYTKNSMVPSGIMIWPESPPKEEKDEIIDQTDTFYVGEGNAGKIMHIFGGNKDALPNFVSFQASNNHNMLNELLAQAQQMIITGHGVTSPVLVGLPGGGTLGGNGNEIIESSELWYNTVIRDYQAPIESAMQQAAAADGQTGTFKLTTMQPVQFKLSEAQMSVILSINEQRKLIGATPVAGGDFIPALPPEELVTQQDDLIGDGIDPTATTRRASSGLTIKTA